MKFTDDEILSGVTAGDFRAISRLITLSENRSPRAKALQASLLQLTKNLRKQGTRTTHTIGVTGSPGAGKSTLVDQLAARLREQKKRVAIVAVDPTSPFTGGAILGDRIRMVHTAEDDQVFIRSMATRGALGGVSRATLDAVEILKAAQFDVVLIETVGVGQAEVDIVRLADTCLVVLVPGMGDSVQAMKAGVLEIADIFLINKADRDGADLVQRDLRMLLSVSDIPEGGWTPPILRTVAINGSGTAEVIAESEKHRHWLEHSEIGKARRLRVMRDTLLKLVAEHSREQVERQVTKELLELSNRCLNDELTLSQAAEQLIEIAIVKGA